MSPTQLLIIKKTSPLPETAEALVTALTQKFGLDAFTARQRLTGASLGLFAQAPREQLEKVADLLTSHGIGNWIITPTSPRFAPQRARGLEIHDESLSFQTGQPPVRLERGDRVVAILADLSGNLIQRNVKKLVVQTAYLGAEAATQLDEDEAYKTVLHNQPVLDLYLLDEANAVRQAVRFFAGRFDPSGLGEHKTYSVAGNLDALLQLVQSYAGGFTLHTDFGLADLPGCRLQPLEAEQKPDQAQLTPLTRFGWLMADLNAQRQLAAQTAKPAVDPSTTEVMLGRTAAATIAGAAGATLPGVEEIAAELQDSAPIQTKAPPARRVLPPPPEFKPTSHRTPVQWLRIATIFLVAIGGLFAYTKGGGSPAAAMRFGMRSGALPALLSLLFGWWGFHQLRVKRYIENLPTSRIRSVAMGLVEVQGYARRKYALVSPMSQQPCVFYRLTKYHRDDEGRDWKEHSSTDCGPIPFELEDDTGRLTIDPAGATIKAGHRQEGFPGQGSMIFAGVGSHDASEKWVEEIIPEGTFIYVTGFARTAADSGSSLHERTVAALRELKQNRQQLHRYDSDGDGQISAEEWQSAREEVEQQVLSQSLEERQSARPQQSRVVIGRAEGQRFPFIVAETTSESHLTRTYAITSTALLALGLGLGIFALVRLVHFLASRG